MARARRARQHLLFPLASLAVGGKGAALASGPFFCDLRRPWRGHRRETFVFSWDFFAVDGEGAARCSLVHVGIPGRRRGGRGAQQLLLSLASLTVGCEGAGAGEETRCGSSISARKACSEARGSLGGAASARAVGQADAWMLNGWRGCKAGVAEQRWRVWKEGEETRGQL